MPQASMPTAAARSSTAAVSSAASTSRTVSRNHRDTNGVYPSVPSQPKDFFMQQGTLAASRDSILTNVGLVAGAATLTAACAQVSFGTPVPPALQTLAVFATAPVLGARRAVAAQLLYLAVGAAGL